MYVENYCFLFLPLRVFSIFWYRFIRGVDKDEWLRNGSGEFGSKHGYLRDTRAFRNSRRRENSLIRRGKLN